MLKTSAHILAPVTSSLFSLCWYWSYTPQIWRQAQVVPIYKKGDPKDPANYRPISLTSHMRKLMEHCLTDLITDNSPPLDISQGGFRTQRSALDQVTCLQHIVHHHTRTRQPPVMIFLDIKSAYDTVDAILNTLPDPKLTSTKRRLLAPYWLQTWSTLLTYIATAEALSNELTTPPQRDPTDDLFLNWIQK